MNHFGETGALTCLGYVSYPSYFLTDIKSNTIFILPSPSFVINTLNVALLLNL